MEFAALFLLIVEPMKLPMDTVPHAFRVIILIKKEHAFCPLRLAARLLMKMVALLATTATSSINMTVFLLTRFQT